MKPIIRDVVKMSTKKGLTHTKPLTKVLCLYLISVDHSFILEYLMTRLINKYPYLIPSVPKREDFDTEENYKKAIGFNKCTLDDFQWKYINAYS